MAEKRKMKRVSEKDYLTACLFFESIGLQVMVKCLPFARQVVRNTVSRGGDMCDKRRDDARERERETGEE